MRTSLVDAAHNRPAHNRPKATTWQLGASEGGVSESELLAGRLRLAVLGAAAGHRRLSPRLISAASEQLQRTLRATASQGSPRHDLAQTIRGTDRTIRALMPHPGVGTSATMVCAAIQDGQLTVAHTGDGTALLWRDGTLTVLVGALPDNLATRVQRRRVPPRARRRLLPQTAHAADVPWIGPRRADDDAHPVMVRHMKAPVELQVGDRIVLCTAPLDRVRALPDLEQLVSEGPADIAAQTLVDVLRVRSELHAVAATVVAWGAEPIVAPQGDLGADLLADLSDLLHELTDDSGLQTTTPEPTARPSAPEAPWDADGEVHDSWDPLEDADTEEGAPPCLASDDAFDELEPAPTLDPVERLHTVEPAPRRPFWARLLGLAG